MARIAGVDIPREKRVEVALTYVFGIGLPTSQKILAQTNINPDTRVRDLTEEQVNRLRELIDRRYKVEGDLDPLLAGDVDAGDTCHRSALPLLVLRVGADDHHGAVAPDDLAVVAARLDGSSDFQRDPRSCLCWGCVT